MKSRLYFTTTITLIVLVVFIINTSVNSLQVQSGRTELQRHDLNTPGREVVQVRVDIEVGVEYPKHTHPGEEIIYVIEGLLEYKMEGKPTVTLKEGDVYFIPSGTIHSVKNVGSTKGSELATYIVEKKKPLVTIVK